MDIERKFIDRTPIICPAGLVIKSESSVAECMRVYTQDDAIETTLNEAGLRKVMLEYPRQRMENVRHAGSFDEAAKLMHPPVETRYQTLLRDLRETTFDDYWKKEVGKCRDPVGGLPGDMNPDLTTFGKVEEKSEPIKDIINPPVSMLEIQLDEAAVHHLYRKTHNDYFPGEQKNYEYKPPFDKNRSYGETSGYDPMGRASKCVIRSPNSEPITISNQIQADYFERAKSSLGKCLAPNNNIKNVPEGHRFGKTQTESVYRASELMAPDITPDLLVREYRKWLTGLYKIRMYLAKRQVDLQDVLDSCLYHDKGNCGWVPLDWICEMISQQNVNISVQNVIPLFEMYGVYKDNFVKYNQFIALLNEKCELPYIGRLEDCEESCPNYNLKYMTTYKAARFDYIKQDNSKMAPAGIISNTLDLKKLSVCVPLDREQLVEPLFDTADRLIRPSIYSNYNLYHWDFFQPREAEYMKTLFENLGYQFPEDSFDKLWALGVNIDETGKVCVDTFKRLMYAAVPIESKKAAEIFCNEKYLIPRCEQ